MVYQQRDDLDRVFACLGDPTRRAILTRLATGEKTISELASRFDMSLPAVSKHIRVLERAGLARVRRHGRARHTALVAAPLREARDWIERYRRFWEHQFDQLATYLEEETAGAALAAPHPPASTNPRESSAWTPGQRSEARRSKSGGHSRRRGSGSSTHGRGRKS